jgi:FG-GAP-like repeat/ASPIC and UnbV
MRPTLLCLLSTIAILAACDDDPQLTPDASPDGAADAGADALQPDTGPPPCGTGNRALPTGLTELKWDSDKVLSNLRAQTFTLTIDGKQVELAQAPLHQAVRFELAHPAKIHGFSVQWANVPQGAAPTTKLEAGLYRDFGHNGFDFWEPDPLWTGTRCAEDVKPGQWLTYVFDKPVELNQPGLVYVAHKADKPGETLFAFDDVKADTCDTFDACHSAINLYATSAIPTGMNFNGVSFSFQYNFMARLHVEYTTTIKESERTFQQQPDVKSNKSGAAWGDYDNDGWDDLLAGGTLYHNDKGALTDVTAASGITAMGAKATGGVWGDYDNDGCLDLFLFSERYDHPDTLTRGDCKGGFTDVTAAAKITDSQSYNACGDPAKNTRSPTAAAAWIDLDADGYLDLYLANFICWDSGATYRDTVFHNKGDGTFEEWTGKQGFQLSASASRGAAPADYDRDGDVDLFVNNYRLEKNLFYRNDGAGKVSEVAETIKAAGNPRFYAKYQYGHSIGAAWGDVNNDGYLDLVVANLAHPRFWHFSDRTQILINDHKGAFSDLSGGHKLPYGNSSGLRYQETHSVPVLADFNSDGNLDLVITNIYDGRPTDFFWGKGDGSFTLDVHSTGITTKNGWAAAASDYDQDGDLDLFATDLFKNTGKQAGHWLQVRVVGNVKANRAALGATVTVKAGSKGIVRHVQGGTGKGCQDSMYLHFGLGSTNSVSGIEVLFPGAIKVTYNGPFAADQRLWLYEDGSVHKGFGPKP